MDDDRTLEVDSQKPDGQAESDNRSEVFDNRYEASAVSHAGESYNPGSAEHFDLSRDDDPKFVRDRAPTMVDSSPAQSTQAGTDVQDGFLLPPPPRNVNDSASDGSASSCVAGKLIGDWDLKPGQPLTTMRKLTLLPVGVAKVVSGVLGTLGMAVGFGVGKVGESLGQGKTLDSEAWKIGVHSWMYMNGVFPTVEYDPIDEKMKMQLKEEYDVDAESPEDMTQTPLIIGNHVSYLDAMLFGTLFRSPRFVAKASLRHSPLGGLMEEADTLFVDRTHMDSREATKQAIDTHCRQWKAGSKPLCIFPEGTTTNGETIIPFKAGAFAPGVPVRPAICVYTGKYDPACTNYLRYEDGSVHTTDDVEWVTELLGHMIHGCHLRVLQPYIPNEKEKQDAKLYAGNVHALCSRELARVKADLEAKSWKQAVGRESGALDFECGDFTRLLFKEYQQPSLDLSFTAGLAGLFGCVGCLHDQHSPPFARLQDVQSDD